MYSDPVSVLAIVLFILAVIQFVLDKIIRKNDEKISHTDGCIPYRWFIVIWVIVVTLFFLFVQEPHHRHVGSGVLLVLLFGVRSIFEWKYIRSSQQHVISLLMMVISLVSAIVFLM
nr:DUF4181 domain-containing protein [Paenibacillus faecalis]